MHTVAECDYRKSNHISRQRILATYVCCLYLLLERMLTGKNSNFLYWWRS